jgi:acetyl esterase/lipase
MRIFQLLLLLVLFFTPGQLPAISAQKPASSGKIVFEPDIEFANPDGQHLKLNLARPTEGDGPFPAVMCIHGGGWRAGTRQHHDGLCKRLAEQGYVAVTVSYRFAPKYQFPAQIHDVKEAVRWLRANAKKYKIDLDHIGVMGDSAGGHLAHLLGVTSDVKNFEGTGGNPDQSSKVQCVVSFYGPTDLAKSYDKSTEAAKVLTPLLGGDQKQAPRNHILASPLHWVTPNAAPTLCIQGTKDALVHQEQAEWMIARLESVGVDAELLLLEGAGHGFGGKNAERADKAMFAFLAKHLKPKIQDARLTDEIAKRCLLVMDAKQIPPGVLVPAPKDEPIKVINADEITIGIWRCNLKNRTFVRRQLIPMHRGTSSTRSSASSNEPQRESGWPR